jgi:NAD(P)-dependent dehydrogenase (short-subunit alcohol dehydrogenase family)
MVLVTGAAGHLGRAIVWGLAEDGALPILNGRRVEPLREVAEALSDAGYDSVIAPGDVADCSSMEATLERMNLEAANRGRRFDGLVNNAFSGTSSDHAPDAVTLFADAARVNLGAVAHLTRCFSSLAGDYPRSVVNIASMYGLVSPDPSLYPEDVPVNPMHYGATKAGLLQLTRYLAVDLAAQRCRVNAVAPGAFPAPAVRESRPEFAARLAARAPLKRLGETREVYPPVRFLLRPDASFITGSTVTVDGGWTAI